MGGKSDAPPPPDYRGAALEQAQASKEVTNIQNWANRPTQNTPWGRTTWDTEKAVDPATGQEVTKWTQNTSLDPTLQRALDNQFAMQEGRSNLANSFMGRVRDSYSTPMTSYDSAPQFAMARAPKDLQTAFGFRGPQYDLNTGDNPNLPAFDSSYRDKIATELVGKMTPLHERQQSQLETKLANQGLTVGSDAYKTALDQLNQRQAAERYNALDMAGNEAQRLYGMQMGQRQQAFNEDLNQGQFFNSAANLGYNQNLGSAQFGNQARSQQYNLNRQEALDQNQIRQAMIAEEMQKRAMALNEMNAVLSGQQVGMPQMPGFNTASRSETPQILDATRMGYDAALAANNANNAASAQTFGNIANIAGSAFMFSDRRLKSNITRVGTHPIGVGIYEYTMMGMPQRGVIAQEVQKVRPDLVKRHANGYLMVNYGGL